MIELQYDKSAEEHLTAEDKALLLAFVNRPEELKHIATFKGSPKVLTMTVDVYMRNIRIGKVEESDVEKYYYISTKLDDPGNPHDKRFRDYAQTNALKRFTA